MPYYYAFCVLLSAFLIFQVQPMIGKYILPWFGGTPAVWSTVLLFFQALLTAGYAYAYWLLGRPRARLQGIVHLVLLAISLGLLLTTALAWPSPLTPDPSWRPQGSTLPIWGILRILGVSVGFPYFLLASNSTLMQAWFNRDYRSATPYRLYAVSNAGSLLALVSYPFLFEPNLSLRAQARLWSVGYVAFAACAVYLALRTVRQPKGGEFAGSAVGPPENEAQPSAGVYALWIGLAACASALLVSVTSQITQEIAVIPFLWVLPLAVYLLTFILAFSGDRWYSRRLYLAAFLVVSAATVWMLVKWPPFSLLTQLVLYVLLLFVCGMICHGELFKLRPLARFLSTFYLMVALGGALGGLWATLLAPYVFTSGFWELQWAAVACAALLAIVMHQERTPALAKAVRKLRRKERKSRQLEAPPRRVIKPMVIVLVVWVLLLSAAIVLIMREISAQTVLASRSFYGVSRIWEINAGRPELRAYQLTHGRTVHGFQFAAADRRMLPTTFYAPSSGVGLCFLNHPARPGPLRVGALGMGIGVIASYGQPGDTFRFYEINPDVIRIAQGEGGYFSYLKDSRADLQVIAGDARVSLEQELANHGSQDFDLLVLDAFSGDTIPLHLLTKEAFAVYLGHLQPDGIIAVHVSNRYFDLYLEVYRLADRFDLDAALIQDHGDGIQSYDSLWMLVTRNRSFLELPAISSRTTPRPPIPANLPAWTDDFSNLLQVLK